MQRPRVVQVLVRDRRFALVPLLGIHLGLVLGGLVRDEAGVVGVAYQRVAVVADHIAAQRVVVEREAQAGIEEAQGLAISSSS